MLIAPNLRTLPLCAVTVGMAVSFYQPVIILEALLITTAVVRAAGCGLVSEGTLETTVEGNF